MSNLAIQTASPTCGQNSIGDRFAIGLLVMLVVNFGQRIVGIVRNVAFCHFLSDAELGQWALANSFFIIAAPLIVLGLPGSFGKFVEHYRQRLCLNAYLRRVAIVCAISTLLLALVMLVAKDSLAWMIYGSTVGIEIIAWTSIALLAQVVYNFVFDVTLSLRQVRVISWMQFSQGMSFAIFGMFGLGFDGRWMVLLPSWVAACLVGSIVGGLGVRRNCGQEFHEARTLPHREMWPRILPFAVSLWLSNLLAGSFELSDRYMLLHLSVGGEAVGQALVGQYYCGRIVPNLLTSIALTLSGVLLPYLSADWEARRYGEIQRRMGYVLTLFSLAFTAVSVAALLFSPILFQVIFKGRYDAAQSILAPSLLQCIWGGLSMIAGAYLLCAERARAASFNLFICLLLNIGLNIPLIHSYGLTGSVVATLIANFVLLLLTLATMSRAGCRIDARTVFFSLCPVIILLGTHVAAIGLTLMVVISGRTNWILNQRDRSDIDALVLPILKKIRVPITTLWP